MSLHGHGIGNPVMTFKLIYLARRNPALTPEEFQTAWRSHSRLASKYATTLGTHYNRVIQCLKTSRADVPGAFLNDIDGVAMLTMKSWEDLEATRRDSHVNTVLRDDEPRVFADYVDKSMVAVEETIRMARGPGRHGLLSFFPVRPGIDREAFLKSWTGPHAATLLESSVCRLAMAYHQNRVVDHPGAPFDFGGVAEIWTETLEDGLAIARSPDFNQWMADLAEVVDLPRVVSMLAHISFEKRLGVEVVV